MTEIRQATNMNADSPETVNPVEPSHNLAEYSVSELAFAIKRTLETGFDRVRVKGEISGFKRAASGHLYMVLKDENAGLKAVCWKGVAGRLSIRPEEGMEVVATGRITSYAERSEYQLVIERLELAGIGALLKMLEDRRRKLAAEGLFDADRKRPLPLLPQVIGVVTSPTGAVIRDILHRLEDRFPRHVLLWPVLVQGEGAAAQIAAAIRGFNALPEGGAIPRPDLLIVARGGGSLEDLMAFNEEIVVRAAAESQIPLISAVGHETDTTLIDYAADRRAPTPTAAAEMAVPVRADLLIELGQCGQRLARALNRRLTEGRLAVEGLGRGLPDPQRLLQERGQQLDQWVERWLNARIVGFDRRRDQLAHLAARLRTPREQIEVAGTALRHAGERLTACFAHGLDRHGRQLDKVAHGLRPVLLEAMIERRRAALDHAGALLDSYSYTEVLKRGFVLVRHAGGAPIGAAAQVTEGQALHLQFHDGVVDATAGAAASGETGTRRSSRKTSTPGDSSPQGSLL
ncbi:MAG: exodeoxyribonuclease VII large subunit [Dongiaceae bacterium]